MDKFAIVGIATLVIVAFIFLYHKREAFSSGASIKEPTTLINYIDASNIPLYERVGGVSKCYSCEADAFKRSCGNSFAAINTRPLKYYEGMPLPEIGYARMGYMT
jgi:hypothetical protein